MPYFTCQFTLSAGTAGNPVQDENGNNQPQPPPQHGENGGAAVPQLENRAIVENSPNQGDKRSEDQANREQNEKNGNQNEPRNEQKNDQEQGQGSSSAEVSPTGEENDKFPFCNCSLKVNRTTKSPFARYPGVSESSRLNNTSLSNSWNGPAKAKSYGLLGLQTRTSSWTPGNQETHSNSVNELWSSFANESPNAQPSTKSDSPGSSKQNPLYNREFVSNPVVRENPVIEIKTSSYNFKTSSPWTPSRRHTPSFSFNQSASFSPQSRFGLRRFPLGEGSGMFHTRSYDDSPVMAGPSHASRKRVSLADSETVREDGIETKRSKPAIEELFENEETPSRKSAEPHGISSAEVEPTNISLSDDDMYTVPPIETLTLFKEYTADNLVVGHKVHGNVQFVGFRHISGLNLSKIVQFREGGITIEPSSLDNGPMLVTLNNVTRDDFLKASGLNQTTLSDKELEELLQKLGEEMNAMFIQFVEEMSVWKFMIRGKGAGADSHDNTKKPQQPKTKSDSIFVLYT